MKVYVKDAALSRFGKHKQSLIDIIRDSINGLDNSIEPVEAVFIGLMNPEEFVGVGNIASYYM